jgi:aspartyl protease family protein
MENNDLSQIVYLVILILIMGYGMINRKEMSLKKIVKYFLIWSLIGLIIIALYAYRFEFNNFKERISGEINPTSAQLNQQGQLIINISDDSHFYVKMLINKKSILFMVDTGASDIVLNLQDALKIGINPKNLIFNRQFQTANGRVLGASIILKEVEISGIKFRDVKASVTQGEMGVNLLGMSFLRRFDKYEFYQDRLILTGYEN